MSSHRILHVNALATALCGIGLLAARGWLHASFGLDSPLLLDVVAVVFLVYAAALGLAAGARPVGRPLLLAFAAADGVSVAAAAVALLVCWPQFTPLAKVLVVAVAAWCEVFAWLQYKAGARRVA